MMGPTGCTGRIGRWTDRSIFYLSEWVHLQEFGRSFLHPRGSFRNQLWILFDGLGGVLETLGPPGVSRGGRVETVSQKVARGSFVGPPPGPHFGLKSTKN